MSPRTAGNDKMELHVIRIRSDGKYLFANEIMSFVSHEYEYIFNLYINVVIGIVIKKIKFAQRGARTHDPEIKSLMLYRLS